MRRRPLATREKRWAVNLARALSGAGIPPNAISTASLVFAVAAGLVLWRTGHATGLARVLELLAAAACIQLRLLCNMLDGMVAIEGGRQTAYGELFNDMPDRFADIAIFVGAGYGLSAFAWGPALGWLAALFAVLTAYVRLLGGAMGARQYFSGPLAKPQRMAVMTFASILIDARAARRLARAGAGRRSRCGRVRLGRDARWAHVADRCRDKDTVKAHRLAGAIAPVVRVIAGAQVTWRFGLPQRRQTVFFANHTSHLDFVVLWASLPQALRVRTRPVAAQDYWETGVRRVVAVGLFNSLLVPRTRGGDRETAARAAIDRIVEGMGDYYSLIIFPEGTRGDGEVVAPFKSGLYYLCGKSRRLRWSPHTSRI